MDAINAAMTTTKVALVINYCVRHHLRVTTSIISFYVQKTKGKIKICGGPEYRTSIETKSKSHDSSN